MKIDSKVIDEMGRCMENVYRILTTEQWERLQEQGVLRPEKIDIESGYIHLSSWQYVLQTANLYFHSHSQLRVVEMDSEILADKLVYEVVPSRNNALFPHYYGDLIIGQAIIRTIVLIQSNQQGFRVREGEGENHFSFKDQS